MLSILIPCYNYKITDLVFSLVKMLGEETITYEIIVVDNASTDNSVAILKQFSFVEVIQSETNLGFGKANNIGIQKALEQNFDYYFLLNQDTWIEPDAIQNLVAVASKNQGQFEFVSFGCVDHAD